MTGNANTLVTSGRCAEGLVRHSSVRPHLTTGVTVASAGILALSLVATSAHVDSGRTDGASTGVHELELTAFALAPELPSAAILETLIGVRPKVVVPGNRELGGGADITIAAATTLPTLAPVLQPSGAIPQAENELAIQSHQQATQLDISWIGAGIFWLASLVPGPLAGIVVGSLFAITLAVVPPFLAFIYDPIVKTVNLALDVLGLPLLPVYVQDEPTTTQANETIAATMTTNTLSSNPVAPLAKTGPQSGEPLSASVAKTDETPSVEKVAQTGKTRETRSTQSVAESGESLATTSATEIDLGTSTDRRTPTGQTLSTTPAKLRPVASGPPAMGGQRPNGLRSSGDTDPGTPAAARGHTATTGAASQRGSTSAGNSPGSSSSSGKSPSSSSSHGNSDSP
jgi:hypothetical protein